MYLNKLGNNGNIGKMGEIGEKGFRGEEGLKGEKGISGDKGNKGIAGLLGLKGLSGSKGEKGYKGVKGEIGLIGDEGNEGGNKGNKGKKGSKGIKGICLRNSFEKGLQGNLGQKGKQGEMIRGEIGDKGSKGNIGNFGNKPQFMSVSLFYGDYVGNSGINRNGYLNNNITEYTVGDSLLFTKSWQYGYYASPNLEKLEVYNLNSNNDYLSNEHLITYKINTIKKFEVDNLIENTNREYTAELYNIMAPGLIFSNNKGFISSLNIAIKSNPLKQKNYLPYYYAFDRKNYIENNVTLDIQRPLNNTNYIFRGFIVSTSENRYSFSLYIRVEIYRRYNNNSKNTLFLRKFSEWFKTDFLCENINLENIKWYSGYSNLKYNNLGENNFKYKVWDNYNLGEGSKNIDKEFREFNVPQKYWSYDKNNITDNSIFQGDKVSINYTFSKVEYIENYYDKMGNKYEFNSEHFGYLRRTNREEVRNSVLNKIQFRLNQISFQLGVKIPI